MTNLFFVITPIQYLNALEYKSLLGDKDRNILVFMSSFNKTRDEITKMLDTNLWDKVFWLSKGDKTLSVINYLKYIVKSKMRINTIIKKYIDVSTIVIGNYNDVINHYIIQKTNYKSLVLIDDGLGSVNISKTRLVEVEENRSILELERYNKIRPKLAKWILRVKNFIPPVVTFFSSNTLTKNNNDFFLVNNYNCLKTSLNKRETTNAAYFIGQPLTELNRISETYYFNVLTTICKKFSEGIVYYIPHRTENPKKLEIINNTIMPVKQFGIPIELAIIQESNPPSAFITLFSSALVNLMVIFGNIFKYKVVKISKNNVLINSEGIEDVYKRLEHDYQNIFEFYEL